VALFLLLGCGTSQEPTVATPDAGAPDASIHLPPRATDAGHDAAHQRDQGVDAALDAVNDGYSGAASDVYPAPHPPLPQLVNAAGGPVLTTPKTYLVYYPGYTYMPQLETFATNMTTASYWGETTSQYGVGALSYGGTIELTGQTAPTTISSTTIQSWVASELESGAFGTPDPEGIYTIFYPEGTLVTQPNPISSGLAPVESCVAFGGYHDNTTATFTDGGTPQGFAYAVIPTCSTEVDDLTAVLSHEWVEASTDPFLTASGTFSLVGGPDSAYFTVDTHHAVWALLAGGEAGDLCESEGQAAYVTPPDVGFIVQRTWSNLLARASHDPCTPSLANTSYFQSVPVLSETVTVNNSLTGMIVTQGVTIPAGKSATLEVDLFSDAETTGPWTVSAADVLYEYYGSYGLQNTLAFEWDRTQGVNGDKLHVTITVTRESILDGLHAFVIASTLGGRQNVWPGLIVE
jgi:hypothetical protein